MHEIITFMRDKGEVRLAGLIEGMWWRMLEVTWEDVGMEPPTHYPILAQEACKLVRLSLTEEIAADLWGAVCASATIFYWNPDAAGELLFASSSEAAAEAYVLSMTRADAAQPRHWFWYERVYRACPLFRTYTHRMLEMLGESWHRRLFE